MSKHIDFTDEIELLETTLGYMKDAIGNLEDVPYYKYLKDRWEDDIKEVQERLDELHNMQNNQWEEERRHEINEYWGNVI